MPETIEIDVPRRGIGSDLTEALAALRPPGRDRRRGRRVQVASSAVADDERERLVAGATHAIEAYLADRGLPLIVQRANGGASCRPPSD